MPIQLRKHILEQLILNEILNEKGTTLNEQLQNLVIRHSMKTSLLLLLGLKQSKKSTKELVFFTDLVLIIFLTLQNCTQIMLLLKSNMAHEMRWKTCLLKENERR